MKHTLKITLMLVLLFFLSQIVGLAITNQYIDREKTAETGVMVWEELPYEMERPPVEESSSFVGCAFFSRWLYRRRTETPQFPFQ